jgi:hypothetical protein
LILLDPLLLHLLGRVDELLPARGTVPGEIVGGGESGEVVEEGVRVGWPVRLVAVGVVGKVVGEGRMSAPYLGLLEPWLPSCPPVGSHARADLSQNPIERLVVTECQSAEDLGTLEDPLADPFQEPSWQR